MTPFEIRIVSKEYRWVYVEAEDAEAAKNQVWEMVYAGYTSNTKPEDYDTELEAFVTVRSKHELD